MRTRFLIVSGLLCLIVIILTAAGSSAQTPVLVNYQGKLTDNGGTPLNGTHDLTFTMYRGLVQNVVWSETQNSVPVNDGLFSVTLGSVTYLYDTTFSETPQWLGIAVDGQTELSPRTRLTVVPGAAYSYRVLGSVQTSDGSLAIENPSGAKVIELNADADSSVLAIDWSDPNAKAFRRPGFRATASAAGNLLKMFTGQTNGTEDPFTEFGSDLLGELSWRIFDPQPEPPGKMFEIIADAQTNPAMRFFNLGEEVMGVEPSPFNSGYALKAFDPQPEPPGIAFELGNEYGQRATLAYLNMYGPATGGAYRKHVALTSDGSGGFLRLGPGTDIGASVRPNISLSSTDTESRIDVTGVAALATAPPIALITNDTDARIGIGTTTPSQALQVIGNICYTGTIGACSDIKYKKDVREISGALDAVGHLNGVRYSWRTDEFPSMHFSDTRQVGFVAQNVRETLPEAVTEDADGSLSVDYSRVTPLLVEAIKELKAENEQLKKRLEALEKK